MIDVDGNGINLTGQLSGVYFDLNADGRAEKISWTGTGSDDAWLALDRDGNGIIDNGRELFGNMTAPRPENYENGFLELAAWDQTEYGGNADGQISDRDSVYSDLKLWQDKNHNGISEPGELQSFPDLGLRSIALDYKKASARDRNGNVFKFRSKVIDIKGFQLGRWARDVLLKSSQGSSARPTYTSKKTRLSRRKRG